MLDYKAQIIKGDILSRIEDVESFHYQLSHNTIRKELVYLWEKPVNTRPFTEILAVFHSQKRSWFSAST